MNFKTLAEIHKMTDDNCKDCIVQGSCLSITRENYIKFSVSGDSIGIACEVKTLDHPRRLVIWNKIDGKLGPNAIKYIDYKLEPDQVVRLEY